MIWNIAHTIATQQLLVYKLSGLPMIVNDDFVEAFRKGTKPEGLVTQEEVAQMHTLLFTTLAELQEDYEAGLFKDFKEYTLSTTGGTLTNVGEALEFNNYHEGLHLGCVVQLSKLVKK